MIEITFSCQNGCTGELEQVWKDEICMNTIITHSGVISSLCISGDTLYSGSWDGTIKVRLLAWQPGLAYISIITFIFFIVILSLKPFFRSPALKKLVSNFCHICIYVCLTQFSWW